MDQGARERIALLEDHIRILGEAMRAFTVASPEPTRLLDVIARSLSEAVEGTCIVFLLADGGTKLNLVAAHDPNAAVARGFRDLLATESHLLAQHDILRTVLATGEPVFLPQIDAQVLESRTTRTYYDYAVRIGVHSLFVVPIRAQGTPFGTLSLLRHGSVSRPFSEHDIGLACELAAFASLALDNARMLDRLSHDDHERGRAEAAIRQAEELRRTQDELLRVNGFLHAIIENIPDMIFVKEARRLSFEMFNKAGEDLLGLSRADLIGKNDYDFFPKEEADFFQAKDRETLALGTLVDIPEEPLETQRGRRWLHTKKVPILGEGGEPSYLLGISRDITADKEAAAALQQAQSAMASAMKELEAFSYSVAHDLRAPLRSVDGFSQSLLEDYGERLDEEGRSHLRTVRAAAQKMGQIIDALLALSRVTRTELKRQPVDLTALALTTIKRLRHTEPERAVEVEIGEQIVAKGDPRLLSIALDNLLSNAWKFSRRRDVAHIGFGVADRDGKPVYFVWDDGAGFDMAYAPKLFGAFQRLHGVTEFEGTGIGLATVQRIIARHGGSIWAEAEVDRGATFYFTLEAEP